MNKYTRPIESTLLRNKLDKLSAALKTSLGNKDLSTLESQLTEASNILSSFYTNLGKPVFKPRKVTVGSLPDPDEFNRNIKTILDDLEVMYAELENIESLVLQNFNYFISQSNRLNSKVKSIGSILGNYILYANNALKDSVYFRDSFSNLDNIETDKTFYSNAQAEVNQAEGIITLPVIQSPDTTIKVSALPIINSNSNGVTGNNQEIGAVLNDNIKAVLDNNPDTWFEYERVTTGLSDDGLALVLDLRMDMSSNKIINFIRINPNNFGTKTQVEIDDISTSLDGSEFISVKDEIPVPGYTTNDEPNIFILAPSTSKYAGQGLYTFTPRLARYIHITLVQKSPYTINTLTGPKLRYAIGIRDIEVQGQKYKNKGEVVSSEYITSSEIAKLILLSSQNPSVESDLASITHQISPDNGNSWIDIRPKEFTGESSTVNSIKEILDFNSEVDGSVKTTDPVKRIRYRAILNRDSSSFTSGTSSLFQSKAFKTELHQLNNSAPFSITLQDPPIANSVTVIDPHFGSRGLNNYKYLIAIGTESAQLYSLPWRNIPPDLVKLTNGSGNYFTAESNPVRVYVHGQKWTPANLTTSSAKDTVFNLDLSRGLLRFGNGINGRTPDSGSPITIDFTPERLMTDPSNQGHLSKLRLPTSGDKKAIEIKRVDPISYFNEPITKVGKTFRLSKKNLQAGSVLFKPAGGSFVTEKTFIDGTLELVSTGHYSIDYESGILYCFTPTGDSSEVTVYYKYQPELILSENDWDFVDKTALKDTLLIKNSAWGTIAVNKESIPSGVKKLSLANFNIEPGSIKFSDTTTFATEVKFFDGRTEILGLIRAQEVIPSGVLVGTGVKTFNLSLIPADTTNHIVAFSNSSIFITSVAGIPAINGEYQVVGTQVKVMIAGSVANPGFATYFYQDPTKLLSGVYSVDYKSGDIYTFTATTASTVDYQYSNYLISYPIARVVPEEDVEVDIQTKKITLSDREILRRVQIPVGQGGTGIGNTYQVLYNYPLSSRAGISELEPYFTPILKEYILKVLPKSKIF